MLTSGCSRGDCPCNKFMTAFNWRHQCRPLRCADKKALYSTQEGSNWNKLLICYTKASSVKLGHLDHPELRVQNVSRYQIWGVIWIFILWWVTEGLHKLTTAQDPRGHLTLTVFIRLSSWLTNCRQCLTHCKHALTHIHRIIHMRSVANWNLPSCLTAYIFLIFLYKNKIQIQNIHKSVNQSIKGNILDNH